MYEASFIFAWCDYETRNRRKHVGIILKSFQVGIMGCNIFLCSADMACKTAKDNTISSRQIFGSNHIISETSRPNVLVS